MARLIARPHPADEGGSVLVIAMMVMGVALSLAIVIVGVSITSGRTSGQDRSRLTTIDAAEAGIDGAYVGVQTGALALPCNWPLTGTTDTKSYPYTTSAHAKIRYYNSSGAELDCSGMTLPSASFPTRAVIESIGTTETSAPGGAKQRKMEALVNLLPVGGNVFTKALTGEVSVTIPQGASLLGNVGNDADIYTNGTFLCGNSAVIRGSVYAALGTITMNQTCTAAGDVWGRGNVVLSGNKTIGGNVLSSSGSITADNNTTINGILTANGDIRWPNNWPGQCTVLKCLRFQSAVPTPPSQPFPILRGDPATLDKWAADGYDVLGQADTGVGCDGTASWIKTHAPLFTRKTLLRTSCAVTFANTGDINFAQDFALFAYGGINTSQTVTFKSVNATIHNVYMVIPYDVTQMLPCHSPQMATSNSFSSTSAIRVLWYSPCDISYGNNGESYGSVYGGTVTANCAFTLYYRPITVDGLDITSAPPLSYKVDIIYKREDRVS
jgi:hypothetical protein